MGSSIYVIHRVSLFGAEESYVYKSAVSYAEVGWFTGASRGALFLEGSPSLIYLRVYATSLRPLSYAPFLLLGGGALLQCEF